MENKAHLGIVIASENSIPFLISALQQEYTNVYFFTTSFAQNKKFSEGISNVLLSKKISVHEDILINDDVENNAILLSDEVSKHVIRFIKINPGCTVSLNIAGGLKTHTLAFWISFTKMIKDYPQNNIKLSFCDMQRKKFINFSVENSVIIQKDEEIEVELTLIDIVALYSKDVVYDSNNFGIVYEHNLSKIKEVEEVIKSKKYSNISDEISKAGNLEFEKIILNELIKRAKDLNISRIYWNVRLMNSSDNKAFNEYDIILIRNLTDLVVIECKDWSRGKTNWDKDVTLLKIVSAHKASLTTWGLKFAKYIIVVNDPNKIVYNSEIQVNEFKENMKTANVSATLYKNGLARDGFNSVIHLLK